MEGDPRSSHVEYRPEVADWMNSEKNFTDRSKDWIDCGGNDGGGIKLPRPTGNIDKDFAVGKIKYDETQACMMKKRYRYIGTCRGPEGVHYACKHKKY